MTASGRPGGATARLHMTGVTKTFNGNVALDNADLRIESGEIHGLVGQNGSGKSTLIKVLAGYHVPDDGAAALIDGEPLRLPPRPRDLIAAQISFVHQDLGLIDQLSVAENVCVGQFERSGLTRRIDWNRQRRIASDVLERIDVHLDPNRIVGSLAPAERASVAIARGLLRQQSGQGLIVLDEATRALPPDSLGEIHAMIRRVSHEGGSVLVVSHNLEEVMAVTDRVTVLRDGKVVGAGLDTPRTSENEVAALMLGRTFAHAERQAPRSSAQARLRAESVAGRSVVDASFEIGEGEIVGVTGLSGSGFEDLPYLLAGAVPARSGAMAIDGTEVDLRRADVARLKRLGVAMVPARRDRDGLAFELTIADNITLPRIRESGGRLFIGNAWRRKEARDVIALLDVRPPDPEMLVHQLSGGNQQKVLLGKWLVGSPKVLILHEPTQAVDIAARRDIVEAVHAAARRGLAVLVASIDADELAALCDRVLIFDHGKVKSVMTNIDRDAIIEAIYTADEGAKTPALSGQRRD